MRATPLEFTSGFGSSTVMEEAARPSATSAADRQSDREPRVLLATTGHLPSTARLAMALHEAGAKVSLIAPRNHPGKVLDIYSHCLVYRASAPLACLQKAMLQINPDIVIPCDERTVRDLHALHGKTPERDVRLLIERSLGPATSFAVTESRDALLSLARYCGVRVPDSAPLPDAAALDAWIAEHPAPFVLKADGSWSGFGVRIISDASHARAAFAELTQPAGLRLGMREMLLEGNNFALRSWFQREKPVMSAQTYIDGWPANIGVACWRGKVIAATCVESVATVSATGPSTVARLIDNPDMVQAARSIVKALNLSGLIGLDFMIEAATGFAYLIEMNPRNTPICAVRLGVGRDLIEALTAKLAGRKPRERPAKTERDILVFFPDTWRRDPSNQFLHSGYHDVPWEQPDLVRVLMQPELRDRYWITRLLRKAWWLAQGHARPPN